MLYALRILTILIGMFHHGPVATTLHDGRIRQCGAPPMAEVMAELVESAERHYVPVSVLTAVCLKESGLNPCAWFCGVGPNRTRWACLNGAQCEGYDPHPNPRVELRQQMRAAAFILARQYERGDSSPHGPSWAHAIHGYHTGHPLQAMTPCQPSHRHGSRHHGVYALQVLAYANRFEREEGRPDLDVEESALWAQTLRARRIASR